ncbi:Neuronal acetylcholine receptor subunit alpha-3 [Mizuhopecten yessoensis]|uniref:Neuronal acetylcholine receptor subunit alpha-3 n=1 Tax=Mizuhopecten yessoensis TaxID=6573 RepID=A0A210Q4R9_MIZYE|nr:Neuronal acetylcholine receptor subunit alpha-3 [Mizuhopecten yessoensis]
MIKEMNKRAVIFIGCWFLMNLGSTDCFTVNGANSVHASLWTGYNNLVRPSDIVTIKVEFVLLSINELNLKQQKFSTSGFFTMFWTDSRLTWTPASHENISFIYTSEAKIWKPELVVDNSVTQISVISDANLLFRVDNNGHVKWEPPGIYDTHCEIDITWFPFDRQSCYIELTSWGYTIDVVNLSHHKADVNLEDYKVNGEWVVESTSIAWKELTADGDKYSQLEFIIHFARRPTYYFMNMIFPVVLISFLTTVVFILPVESGERISFSITVLLALALLLTLISDMMPTTSIHTSVLAIYIMAILTLSTLSVFLTSLNLRLYHKEKQMDVPKWLKKFTQKVLLKCTFQRKYEDNRTESQRDIIQNEDSVTKPDHKAVSTAWEDIDNDTKEEADLNMSCKEISMLFDRFWFILFIAMTIACTFLFLLILGIGARV